MPKWVKLVNFATALEAEMLVARLNGERIAAMARGVDFVGIAGPGFQGATPRGVDVYVTSLREHEARRILAEFRGE